MATQDSVLTTEILGAFFGVAVQTINVEQCGKFQKYYGKTWFTLRHSMSFDADEMQFIASQHVLFVVEAIAKQLLKYGTCKRALLREEILKDPRFQHSEKVINRLISFTLRLWLVMNIQEERAAPGTNAIQWSDEIPLQEFVAQQFKVPREVMRFKDDYIEDVLPNNFTVVNLRRYSGIKVDWIYDFSQHLHLDRDHRRLKVFPLKYYLQGLRKSPIESIPNDVLDEYMKTMNFLFPDWDDKTRAFLERKEQTFGMEAPVGYPGPLYLSDFHFWRDRLSILYTEFCSPPPSMTQLFNDRRNVLQWYTFWFAVVILALTIIFGFISSVTAGLQTKYSYQALIIAIDAAASSKACPPITCGPRDSFPTTQ